MNTSIKVLSFVLGLITIIILTITGIIYIQANTWPKSVPNGDIFFQSGNDILVRQQKQTVQNTRNSC